MLLVHPIFSYFLLIRSILSFSSLTFKDTYANRNIYMYMYITDYTKKTEDNLELHVKRLSMCLSNRRVRLEACMFLFFCVITERFSTVGNIYIPLCTNNQRKTKQIKVTNPFFGIEMRERESTVNLFYDILSSYL